MSDELKLKLCPFCGHESYTDLDTAIQFGGAGGYAIACSWCEVSAPSRQTFSDAVLAWNTRTDLADAKIAAAAASLDAMLAGKNTRAYNAEAKLAVALGSLRAIECAASNVCAADKRGGGLGFAINELRAVVIPARDAIAKIGGA